MTERTRSSPANASLNATSEPTAPAAPVPDGRRAWTPERLAAEDERINRILDACFGRPDAPFAKRVASFMFECGEGECIACLEEDEVVLADGDFAVGFRVAIAGKAHVAELVDAGMYGERAAGIASDIMAPDENPRARKIVVRFRSGVICVFEATVGLMGRGGRA